MDIGALAGRYGGIAPCVVTRAGEYMRLASARRPTALDLSTPAACLVVAAKAFDEQIDAKRLSSLAGVNHRAVEQTVRKILGIVDVKSVVQTTPAALCIRFGCEAITELVNRVYAEYQVVAERLSRGRGQSRVFDHREPVFAAACLFASSKHANLRVDKVKLLDAVCGNPKSFEAIVSSIEMHCKASLSGAILSRRKRAGAAASPSAKSSAKMSAAALADAADAARAQQSQSQSQSGAGTPLKASTKVLRRLYERSQGSGASADAAAGDSNATPAAGTTPISSTTQHKSATTVTDDEYAAWRAHALAHMRKVGSETRN